ncbi:MAG: zinc ribbon domain-containing protein [Acutalibacteraceae bacterium]
MICKRCGKEIGENETFCRFCGASVNETKKQFVLHIDDEKLANDFSPESEQTPALNTPQTTETGSDEAQNENSEAQQELSQPEESENESPEEKETQLNTQKEILEKADLPKVQKVQEAETENKNRPKIAKAVSAPKDSKQAIKADRTIKIIACVCAIIMTALAIVSIKTDIFKNTAGNKTVALSKLSDEQVVSFEEYAAKLAPLYETGYDSSKVVLDDVIDLMNPTDENGLYASFYGVKTPTSETSDPAKRFVFENSNVSYCDAQSDEIAFLAESLGIEAHDDMNTAECYYYGGKYYFKNVADEENQSAGVIKVISSKRTNDGDFYVTCGLYDENAQRDENGNYISEPQSQLYFLVIDDGTQEDPKWVLENLSDEPLFDDSGERIEEESTGDSLSYEIKQEKFSAKLSDGRVYANYVVECPSFENNGTTAITINSIYDAIISELKDRTDTTKVDKRYENFLAAGGSDDALPLYTHVIASVKYNGDGYISIFERKSTYTGKEKLKAQESETTTSSYYDETQTTAFEAQEEEVFLPETTYEGYTFEIETGEFVKRDDLIGKDYVTLQDKLFNAWIAGGGRLFGKDQATYGTLQTSSDYGSTQVYSDTNGIGKAIYESSWLMTEDSIEFLFKHEDSALDIVAIERGEPEKPELTDTTSDTGDEYAYETTSEDVYENTTASLY